MATTMSQMAMGIALLVSFSLIGIVYGIVINTVNVQADYYKNRDAYIGVAVTSIILVAILGLISIFTINKDPSFTMTYLLIITHISILLSLLSVTFSLIR